MRIPRLYQHPLAADGAEMRLGEVAARHVQSVLRLKPGAAVVIFDGHGYARHAQLVRATRDEVSVLIGSNLVSNAESPLHVTVALGVCQTRVQSVGFGTSSATAIGQSPYSSARRAGSAQLSEHSHNATDSSAYG